MTTSRREQSLVVARPNMQRLVAFTSTRPAAMLGIFGSLVLGYCLIVVSLLRAQQRPKALHEALGLTWNSGRHPVPLRVSCVGDSITKGTACQGNTVPYPDQLQQILGVGYQVSNFGHNDMTASKHGRKQKGTLTDFVIQKCSSGSTT